ncbi:hypothetical protein PR048_017579 [Dryococelus australis]|uniref:Uncharacterized protein n=1 Tax=Dryococelus australis TaxID=614101 RepID=A0ABQ9HA59_9NEOP|nr:hypothetical protein PR048_017579 [Dryococelus australis]
MLGTCAEDEQAVYLIFCLQLPGADWPADYSPPTKKNRIRFPTQESCRTMPLVGGHSRGTPVSPALAFCRCSIRTSFFALIGSQDLDFKSRPNISTHSIEFNQNNPLSPVSTRRETPTATLFDVHRRGFCPRCDGARSMWSRMGRLDKAMSGGGGGRSRIQNNYLPRDLSPEGAVFWSRPLTVMSCAPTRLGQRPDSELRRAVVHINNFQFEVATAEQVRGRATRCGTRINGARAPSDMVCSLEGQPLVAGPTGDSGRRKSPLAELGIMYSNVRWGEHSASSPARIACHGLQCKSASVSSRDRLLFPHIAKFGCLLASIGDASHVGQKRFAYSRYRALSLPTCGSKTCVRSHASLPTVKKPALVLKGQVVGGVSASRWNFGTVPITASGEDVKKKQETNGRHARAVLRRSRVRCQVAFWVVCSELFSVFGIRRVLYHQWGRSRVKLEQWTGKRDDSEKSHRPEPTSLKITYMVSRSRSWVKVKVSQIQDDEPHFLPNANSAQGRTVGREEASGGTKKKKKKKRKGGGVEGAEGAGDTGSGGLKKFLEDREPASAVCRRFLLEFTEKAGWFPSMVSGEGCPKPRQDRTVARQLASAERQRRWPLKEGNCGRAITRDAQEHTQCTDIRLLSCR